MGTSSHSHSHEQLAGRSAPKSGPMRMRTRQETYGKAIRGRFIAIRAEMRRGVVDRDIFGFSSGPTAVGIDQLAEPFDPRTLTPAGFDPTDDARNHEQFMAWLQGQQEDGVLGLVEIDSNLYIRNAAADGVRWANARLREAGESVTTDVEATFNRPQNANKLRLLYQRNYDLLDGLTSDVSRQVSEELSRGLGQGLGAKDTARNIADRIDSVGLRRATLIARHETMYAANEFTKVRYREAGVGQVEVLGSSPCAQCKPHVEGGPYPLDDIPEGGPPFHPQCVGCLTPVI